MRAHAVLVVPQRSVFGDDAFLGELQHALVVELVGCLGQQAVGLGDPVLAGVCQLTGGPDVIVLAVYLDEAGIGTLAVRVVPEGAILGEDAVGMNLGLHQATLIVKLVGASGLDTVGALTPVGLAHYQLSVRTCVVDRSVLLEHADVNADAVDVAVEVAVGLLDGAVLAGVGVVLYHAIGIEVVAPFGQQTVRHLRGDPVVLALFVVGGGDGATTLHEAVVVDRAVVLDVTHQARSLEIAVLIEVVGLAVNPANLALVGNLIVDDIGRTLVVGEPARLGVLGSVGDVGSDAGGLLVPTLEGVGEVVIRSARGRCAIVLGCLPRLDVGVLLQHGAVPVLPVNGVSTAQDHAALLVKLVVALGQQVVGLVHPVGAVLDHVSDVVVGEVVVIAVDVDEAGVLVDDAVLHQVGAAVVSGVEAVQVLLPHAVLAKDIVHVGATDVETVDAGGRLVAGAEVVLLAVDGHPRLRGPATSPHVPDVAVGTRDELTANQLLVLEDVVVATDGLLPVDRLVGARVEEVVLAGAVLVLLVLPARLEHAVLSEVEVVPHLEEAAHLTIAGAIRSKVEPVGASAVNVRQLLVAGKGNVVFVVVVLAVGLQHPAVLGVLVQRVGVVQALVGVGEVGALLVRPVVLHVGVLEGVDAVLLLHALLAAKAVEGARAQVDVVGHAAGVCGRETVLLVPGRVALRRELEAAQDAHGVGRGRVDGRLLVDPVALDGEGVGGRVKRGAGELEVVVGDGKAAEVHVEVGVHLEGDGDVGEHAHALRQLHEEAPGGSTGLVAAGQELDQLRHGVGDGDGGHVQRVGVGGDHRLAGIHH